MKKVLEKLWGALTAYPQSWDDYVAFGRTLIYKKLLVILALLLLAASIAVPLWLTRPKAPFPPTFSIDDDALRAYSGEVILTDSPGGAVIYRGQVLLGLRTGHGREIKTTDAGEETIYEGDFSQDRRHGQGILYKAGEPLYEGGFQDNFYSGDGVLYQNGKTLYSGQFARGVYEGTGTLFENGKKLYEGGFLAGTYSGQGTLYNEAEQVLYTGGFVGGQKEGQGRETAPDGTPVYEGNFRAGHYDGQGALYTDGGTHIRYEGIFLDGIPGRTGSLYNAQGQLLYSGPVRDAKADVIALLGLPLPAVQQMVHEVPTVYYGDTYAAYLYRELGFAAITKYDYSAYQAPSPAVPNGAFPAATGQDAMTAVGGGPDTPGIPQEFLAEEVRKAAEAKAALDLIASPEENLVVNLLILDPLAFGDLIPPDGVSAPKDTLTGFEAFTASRVAGIRYPLAQQVYADSVWRRGDHLYEVTDLPESVAFSGEGIRKNGILYYADTDGLQKGGLSQVLFCSKDKFGG